MSSTCRQSITIQLPAKSFKVALPQILEACPELVQAVRGGKGDSYEYYLSDSEGKVSAEWSKASSADSHWKKVTGSVLEVFGK